MSNSLDISSIVVIRPTQVPSAFLRPRTSQTSRDPSYNGPPFTIIITLIAPTSDNHIWPTITVDSHGSAYFPNTPWATQCDPQPLPPTPFRSDHPPLTSIIAIKQLLPYLSFFRLRRRDLPWKPSSYQLPRCPPSYQPPFLKYFCNIYYTYIPPSFFIPPARLLVSHPFCLEIGLLTCPFSSCKLVTER